MKLGSETNSLVNHIMSRQVIGQPAPEVGMGVTFLCYTDRRAGTIVEVIEKNGKPVMFAATGDVATRVDKNGMSECQEYSYESQMDGPRCWFKLDNKGVWRAVMQNENGRYVFSGGNGIQLGERREYYDFSF